MSTQHYFEQMYSEQADPYGVSTRWYEARKRALLLAALPQARYRYAFEPGCGAGELTAQLAARCDRLLASDFTDRACATARRRCVDHAHVAIELQTLPQDWPDAAGAFDLIVISEVGYFLQPADLEVMRQRCAESLAADGVLVACDWRAAFAERATPTDAVHGFWAALDLPCVARYEDADFKLTIWSRDPRSVAEREGIR